MSMSSKQWICAHCGFYARFRFTDDICPVCKQTDWHCDDCGYTLTARTAPLDCPQCGAIQSFSNISCYIPGWSVLSEADVMAST